MAKLIFNDVAYGTKQLTDAALAYMELRQAQEDALDWQAEVMAWMNATVILKNNVTAPGYWVPGDPAPDPLTPQEMADILDKAADLLEADGWGQHAFQKPDGSMCSVGAIRKAVSGNSEIIFYRISSEDQICTELEKHLDRSPTRREVAPTDAVMRWNDHPGRTMFEVIDLFRATAKDLRNQVVPA